MLCFAKMAGKQKQYTSQQLPTVSQVEQTNQKKQKHKFAKAELSPTRSKNAIPNKRFPESMEANNPQPSTLIFVQLFLYRLCLSYRFPQPHWDYLRCVDQNLGGFCYTRQVGSLASTACAPVIGGWKRLNVSLNSIMDWQDDVFFSFSFFAVKDGLKWIPAESWNTSVFQKKWRNLATKERCRRQFKRLRTKKLRTSYQMQTCCETSFTTWKFS